MVANTFISSWGPFLVCVGVEIALWMTPCWLEASWGKYSIQGCHLLTFNFILTDKKSIQGIWDENSRNSYNFLETTCECTKRGKKAFWSNSAKVAQMQRVLYRQKCIHNLLRQCFGYSFGPKGGGEAFQRETPEQKLAWYREKFA